MDEKSIVNKETFSEWWYRDIGFCGCGIPGAVTLLIRDLLRALPVWEHEGDIEKLIPNEPLRYLVLSWLGSMDMLEHGTSINGSWLTPKGDALLDYLNTLSDPEIEGLLDEE